MPRWVVIVVVIFAVPPLGGLLWRRHQRDVLFARAPSELRPCLANLENGLSGYAVDEAGAKAASWDAEHVILCDREVETYEGGNLLVHPTAAVLYRPSVVTGFFDDAGVLELRHDDGGVERLTFGPPTGMDGPLYIWHEDLSWPNRR